MYRTNDFPNFAALLRHRPDATAAMQGSSAYPNLRGNVRFYQTPFGVMVVAEFSGLPDSANRCGSPIFAFHIHDGEDCGDGCCEPFPNAGVHYNPDGCPHPYHAGDLPPIFCANGFAFSVTLTDRFTVEEVLGLVVVLHSSPDDFTTQPSGNPGTKIACGEIRR